MITSAGGTLRVLAFLLPVVAWMWLAMMLTHELGHVFAAQATGGVLASIELKPGYLSHTLVRPNPRPSVVLWSGFLAGWLTPFLTKPGWQIRPEFIGPVLRAWAAFCLLAGGSYLAIGGSERLTDTGQLIQIGWRPLLLVGIGLLVAAIGYARSRSAWIAIARQLESSPPSWLTTISWWAWLVAWCGGQWRLHAVLAP